MNDATLHTVERTLRMNLTPVRRVGRRKTDKIEWWLMGQVTIEGEPCYANGCYENEATAREAWAKLCSHPGVTRVALSLRARPVYEPID